MAFPLIVFAKAPIQGQVKTRLQSHCSAQQASEIAKILLQETLLKATRYWPGSVQLSVALDVQHPFIQAVSQKFNVPVTEQASGNLGDKMADAFVKFGCPAAIIGSDIPHISEQCLIQAHKHLRNGQNVIGPSNDGGYYLIGLRQPQPAIFQQIKWGSSSVLAETLQKAADANIQLKQLPAIDDVDTWPDLLAIAKQVPALARYLDEMQNSAV